MRVALYSLRTGVVQRCVEHSINGELNTERLPMCADHFESVLPMLPHESLWFHQVVGLVHCLKEAFSHKHVPPFAQMHCQT